MRPDLDPQEALDHDYDPDTDITAEEEQAEALSTEDEAYEPELLDAVPFDAEGWPGDELVIVDLDGIDETEEER